MVGALHLRYHLRTRRQIAVKNQMVFERYELKYLIERRRQEEILAAMEPYMVPDEYSHSSIRNLYLDTPDYRLIRRSLEKPVYKEKIRVRSYGRADADAPVFVELKKKYRSVVYKRRISMPQREALACIRDGHPWPQSQIGRELAYAAGFYTDLQPVVFLSYERDSYRGRQQEEFRVTFDSAIRYREDRLTLDSDTQGIPVLPENMVLMELKAAGAVPLWMSRILSGLGIYQTSFSKYGTVYQTIFSEQMKGKRQYA